MTGTLLQNFRIKGISADGRAYGMHDDITVFVDKGVPGDIADVQMIKSYHSDKTLATGKIIAIKKEAPNRIEPFCKHFKYCGGCQWQNISYADQLQLKQQQIENLIARFSNMNFEMLPVLPSPKEKHFRNRVTFTFSNRRWMSPEELRDPATRKHPAGGFVLRGNNDRIMNIDECFLSDDLATTIMKSLRKFSLENNFSFYDVRHETGFLRYLTLRFGDDGIMAIGGFGKNEAEKITVVMNFLEKNFPQLTSIYYAVHPWKDSRRNVEPHILHSGKKFVEYKMEELVFRSGPASFFQTNTLQALRLYNSARSFAQLTGNEIVYDLYSGTGTIALFVSRLAKKVIGIEQSPEAVQDAEANALLNKIQNAKFISGDLKNIFTKDLFEKHGNPDVVITDPPRSGMHRDGIKNLLDSGAKKIVYISCNPVTQVRDIRFLSSKYSLVKARPVDMFPQTLHIENVVLLEANE